MKTAENKAYATLRQQVAQGQLAGLYLFYGEETYLKEHYKSRLLEQFGGTGLGEFNALVLEGEGLTLSALVDAVEGLPAMAQQKLVILRDLNLSRPPAELRDSLQEILEDLPEYLVLVLYYDALEYKPDKRLKLWQSVLKQGLAVEFAKAPQSELTPWIKRRLDGLGKRIDTGDCEYLTFVCGSLMTNLASEIDKIAAGTPGEQVGRQQIDALACRALEAQIYQLTDRISHRDAAGALANLRDLLALKFEPVVLAGAIGKQMQKLYGAKLVQQSGGREEKLMELFNMRSSYPAKLLLEAARRRSLPWLRQSLLLCAQADKALKSNVSDDGRTLELLVLRLAGQGAGQ